jgi:AraC-like DNA-binding protein
MYFKLIDIINSISCFQLAIFSFFLIHKGRKQISNNILSAFFIVQFIVILNYRLESVFAKQINFYLQIALIQFPFELLWGPLMYFYVKSQVKSEFKFRMKDLVHLTPFIFVLGFIISQYTILDFEAKLHLIESGALYKWFPYFNFPYYLILFAYNFSALVLILNYQRNLKNYCSYVVRCNLNWLKFVLYGYIITCIITAVPSIAGDHFSLPFDLKMIALFFPFLIFFNVLFYKAMIHPYVIIIPDEKPKYTSSNLYNTDIQDYSRSIETYITTKKPYLNPSLTLHDLAESVGIVERIISQVINQHWNQNFFSFINFYRVEEAKKLLSSFDQTKSTMLGISFDAGFNSKSAFYEAFKKHTGMTPTEFRKRIIESEKENTIQFQVSNLQYYNNH